MRRTSGFRIVMLGSKSMARGIKDVSRIWRATRLLRWSMALMIYRCGSSCGLAKRSIWPETSPISPHQPCKKRALERQLTALLAVTTGCDLARKLQAKIARARDQLLTFCDYPGEVDPHERRIVARHRSPHGFQAGDGRVENLAKTARSKPVAESHQ